MATQISRGFKDISLSFTQNPLTNDLIILYNENAIKKSVTNLVRTQFGERFFRPLIGTNLSRSIFELNYIEITETLSEEIRTLLENFEPRIKVQDVQASVEEDNYELNVIISYLITGIEAPAQTIDFILQPSRL